MEESLSQQSKKWQNEIETLSQLKNQSQNELTALEQKLAAEAAEKAALESTLAQQTGELEGKIKSLSDQQSQNQAELASLQDQLNRAEADKAELQEASAAEATEKAALESTLAQQTGELEGEIRSLSDQQSQNQAELAGLQDLLNKAEADKAALESASAARVGELEGKSKQLQGELEQKLNQLAGLEGDIKASEDKIAGLEKGYGELKNVYEAGGKQAKKLAEDLAAAQQVLKDTEGELGRTRANLEETSGELEEALELENRRRDVARQIEDEFRKHGIAADVDSGTGDVIIDFGKDYFDSDSYDLKPGMERTLRKAIPLYAKSLFATDSDVANISSVEIIGFASPTYGGEPVNPVGLSAENRTAVNYNLDLSYERARSIFEYVFDTKKMKFDQQGIMLPLIKVTGRSFFTEKINLEDTGNLSKEEFCRQYNCNQSQRVIIKFGLSEKGGS